jgi:hypothetical protein
MGISPNQSSIAAALRSFLTSVLPAGVSVLLAQQNRVPEPAGTEFVIMTPIRMERLETNVDSYNDVRFQGSISGNTLSVSNVSFGTIVVGAQLNGTGVIPGTTITALGTGAGGTGTYLVSQPQTIPSQVLSSGAMSLQQNAKVTVQLDFHSQNDTLAGDYAQIVSTLLRDDYGVSYFAGLPPPQNSVAPLYADDPAQRPFVNENQQYEWRWVLECVLQANQVVSVPQQFADSAMVVLKTVQ